MVSRSEFYDYESYVKKFQGLPSTTDDTFTPEGLYCDLLDYIDRKIFPLSGYRVERPFYPGGNYETYDYQENSVVIDNPPFSICGKIREFYLSRGIRYFLFIPPAGTASSTGRKLFTRIRLALRQGSGLTSSETSS